MQAHPSRTGYGRDARLPRQAGVLLAERYAVMLGVDYVLSIIYYLKKVKHLRNKCLPRQAVEYGIKRVRVR